MKIIVTGGAGFIGSALIRYLINETDHSVVNIDKLTYAGNLNSLESINHSDRYKFVKLDICNTSDIKQIFIEEKPDLVMHLAAESHVDRSIDGPAEFIQTNIVGTFTLLEVSRKYWVGLEGKKKDTFRFHHISTDEVYGDLNETDLFTEDTPYAPSSPYSASKASSDHLVRAWNRTYGLPVIVTNCSNNYGPYHFPEKLIPLIILNALEGKNLPIYGNGQQIRDWLYVEDHAQALYKVVTEGAIGETYNIGGFNEKSNLNVVKSICSLLDELVPVAGNDSLIADNGSDIWSNKINSYSQLITFVKDRPGHDVRYAIDASKIERELGWHPEETFETGLRKTVLWYLENSIWCDNVLDRSNERQGLGSNL